MMESLLRELRLAIRSLARNPGFTAVGVLTLALGIGATTAVFSVVYGVLFRPLPFPRADQLVQIVQVTGDEPGGEPHRVGLTPDQFLNLQEHSTTLDAVGVFTPASRTLTGIPIPARLNGASVLPGLFDGLGARALRGRTFRPEDGDAGPGQVVILSYRTWRTHFGGREDIIDSRIMLDDTLRRVVGIMPESFTFPSLAGPYMSRNSAGEIEDAPEFWITGARFERSTGQGFTLLRAHALVKPGVGYERALAEVRSLIGPLPDGRVVPVELVNARVEMSRDASRPLAIFQLGMVLVLLIACVNVVNLLLTRAAGRRRELAVRMALGATHGQIVREGLAEAIVLSIAGGTLGCALAYASIAVLRTLPPHVLPRLRDIHVDGVVLGFALGLSIVTGLLVGLFSALRVARASVSSQLRPQTPYALAGLPGGRLRPSSLLVVAEIAAAVVLLISGGLLVNSFVRLVQMDLGYDPRHVATFQVALPTTRYPTSESRERFSRDIATSLRTLPGVDAVSATDSSVTYYSALGFYPLTIDGKSATTAETEIRYRRVSPDYFRTLRIPVVEGREFRHDDWSPVTTKVIVNQAFARQHFPGSSPIGHHLRWSDYADLEVIGVVADSRERPDADIERAFYLTIDTGFAGRMTVLMRADRDPAGLLSAARGVLARIDPQLASYDAASLEEVFAHSAASPRLYGFVSLLCAIVALALAAIGLYGVLAYSVGSRTHEFGIRIALGADARAIRWQVLRQGLAITTVGLAIGLAGSYASNRALTSLLFGITPNDMTTFATAATLLTATAIAACLVPSHRATRVDPVVALRAE
jgi:putative ABC transport system permease protein